MSAWISLFAVLLATPPLPEEARAAAPPISLSSTTSEQLLARFLRYVRVDSQADGQALANRDMPIPSSKAQLDLNIQLQQELLALGLNESQAYVDDTGSLVASFPPTSSEYAAAPTVAFFAHVDTADSFKGTDVKPIVHVNWKGDTIELPLNQVALDPRRQEALRGHEGDTIVTASGDTLLGADDKSGVAVLMQLAQLLQQENSAVQHGPVRLVFNTDEEVGLRSAQKIDLRRLGADVGYTLDGESYGEVQCETWSAMQCSVHIQGVSVHPGWSKGKMVNANMLLAKFIAALPQDGISPHSTQLREGFIHVDSMQGAVGDADASIYLRDFERAGLAAKETMIYGLCEGFQASEPRATITCTCKEQYQNMRDILAKDMRPVELALAAYKAVGIDRPSADTPFRGGTDGSMLTLRGLPTPNIFAGWHDAHGPLEWASLREMVASYHVLQELLKLWSQEAHPTGGQKPKDEL